MAQVPSGSSEPPHFGHKTILLLRFCRQGPNQVAQFSIDIRRIGDDISDLGAQQIAEALSQPVDGDLQSGFRGFKLTRQFRVRNIGITLQAALQLFEVLWPPVLSENGTELFDRPVEQRSRPSPFINSLRSLVVGGFPRIHFLAFGNLEREMRRAATTLLRPRASRLIAQIIVEGRQQKRPESSAFRIRPIEVIAFQKTGKKLLGMILRQFR